MELIKCRLCTCNENLKEIFGEDGNARSLAMKINECLPVVVHPGDHLPKLICVPCCNKVEEIHKFWRACEQAHVELDSVFRLQEEQPQHSMKRNSQGPIRESGDRTDKKNADQHSLPVEPDIVMQEVGLPINYKVESTFKIKEPCHEDYVLVKEETFELDKRKYIRSSSGYTDKLYLEFSEHDMATDKDIFDKQQTRKQKLPQMWDVFERHASNSLVTHRRYIISKSAFPCSLCGKCYKIAEALSSDDNESVASSTEFRTYTCSMCDKTFPHQSSLMRHMSLHGDVKPFPCHLCGRGFNRKEHLSRHLLSHTGGRPFNCDICSKPFTRKEHLARHRNITHFTELHSKNLNSNPSSKSQTIKDEQEEDTVEQKLRCNLCGQCFSENEHIQLHREHVHLNVADNNAKGSVLRPYVCNVCNKSFTRKEHLVRHRKIHEKHCGKDLALSLKSKSSFYVDVKDIGLRDSGGHTLEKSSIIDVTDI